MPRYYIGFSNGITVIDDPEGTELPDLTAARLEASEDVKHLSQDRISAGRNWVGWVLQVADESGAVLFSLPLSSEPCEA